jgi:hypothetical protein
MPLPHAQDRLRLRADRERCSFLQIVASCPTIATGKAAALNGSSDHVHTKRGQHLRKTMDVAGGGDVIL